MPTAQPTCSAALSVGSSAATPDALCREADGRPRAVSCNLEPSRAISASLARRQRRPPSEGRHGVSGVTPPTRRNAGAPPASSERATSAPLGSPRLPSASTSASSYRLLSDLGSSLRPISSLSPTLGKSRATLPLSGLSPTLGKSRANLPLSGTSLEREVQQRARRPLAVAKQLGAVRRLGRGGRAAGRERVRRAQAGAGEESHRRASEVSRKCLGSVSLGVRRRRACVVSTSSSRASSIWWKKRPVRPPPAAAPASACATGLSGGSPRSAAVTVLRHQTKRMRAI